MRMNLAAMDELNAQGTWAEEESVPRQGRRGPSSQGMTLLRLSDLTMFPEQAPSYSESDQTWPIKKATS
ncbi:Uncharacterised protein [Pantoea agglomerans]|uniref:Uncharacterized protein n=2 Tax=Pantoea TaxID=53335 RepID=A0A379AMA1_ENTAG|nr:Uncharacterised protein [Pantoea agglomerans]